MKNIFQSLTMNGTLIAMLAPWLAMLGVSTADASGALTNIIAGGTALVQVIGWLMAYIGRKKANPNISILGK